MATRKPELTEDIVLEAIKKGMGKAIDAQANEIVDQAKKDIEAAIRAKVGNIVLNILGQYSIERHGSELIIRVQISGPG
jgi:head-tail adaptor